MGGVFSKLTRHEVILLGMDNAGKSTILKQLQLYHGNGFTPSELTRYKHAIFANTFNTLQYVLFLLDKEYDTIELDYSLNKIFIERIKMAPLCEYDTTELPHRLEIKTLWNEVKFREAIRSVYFDEEFLELLDRVTAHDFEPTTDGIILFPRFVNLTIEGNEFRIIDLDGTKNERSEWRKYLKSSHAIIWVVDVLELADALQIFADTVNEPELIDKPVILALSKQDLLGDKLVTVNTHVSFPYYKSNPTGTHAKERNQFLFSHFVFAQFRDADKSLYNRFYQSSNYLGRPSSIAVSLLKALEPRNKPVDEFLRISPPTTPRRETEAVNSQTNSTTYEPEIKRNGGLRHDAWDKNVEKEKHEDKRKEKDNKKEVETIVEKLEVHAREAERKGVEQKKKMKEDPEQVARKIDWKVELKERPRENQSINNKGEIIKENMNEETELNVSDNLDSAQMETEQPNEKNEQIGNRHEGDIQEIEGREVKETRNERENTSTPDSWEDMEDEAIQAAADAVRIKLESKRESLTLENKVTQAILEAEQQSASEEEDNKEREHKERKKEREPQVSRETAGTNVHVGDDDDEVKEKNERDKTNIDNTTTNNTHLNSSDDPPNSSNNVNKHNNSNKPKHKKNKKNKKKRSKY